MIINKLIENGIEPMVTMFHYDLPEDLSKIGGFANHILIYYFVFYADILFKNFGDRVKLWITFNEPFDYCTPGYGAASYPPLIKGAGIWDYTCMDVTLKAHTMAYRKYKQVYYDSQKGKVGITISSRFYFDAANNKNLNETLLNKAMDYSLGWLATPLFGYGNYPRQVVEHILKKSEEEGGIIPRLDFLTENMSKLVKHSADFLGLNYYTSRYVEEANPPLGPEPSWENDSGLKYKEDQKWKRAKSSWLYCVPEGLEGLLK